VPLLWLLWAKLTLPLEGPLLRSMVPQAHTPNRLERSLLLSKALLCRRVHRRPFRLSPHKPKLLASFRAHNAALNMDLPFWAREGSVLNGIRRKLVNNERKVLNWFFSSLNIVNDRSDRVSRVFLTQYLRVESGLAPNAPHIWQSPSPAELAALLGGDQFGRQRRQPVVLTLRPAILDRHVLTPRRSRLASNLRETRPRKAHTPPALRH
jgi:hypothetical protein